MCDEEVAHSVSVSVVEHFDPFWARKCRSTIVGLQVSPLWFGSVFSAHTWASNKLQGLWGFISVWACSQAQLPLFPQPPFLFLATPLAPGSSPLLPAGVLPLRGSTGRRPPLPAAVRKYYKDDSQSNHHIRWNIFKLLEQLFQLKKIIPCSKKMFRAKNHPNLKEHSGAVGF